MRRAGSGTNRRPSVLFLTYHLPFPPSSGGRRREFELVARLHDAFAVHLCAVTHTYDEDERHIREMASYCASVHLLRADGRPSGAVALNAWDEARFRCHGAADQVDELVACFDVDVLHVENYFLMQHVRRNVDRPVVLVEQNVWFELVRQQSAIGRASAELDRVAAVMCDAERDAWRSADIVGALTEQDRAAIASREPSLDVRILPDGADHLVSPRVASPAAAEMVFVGNFRYDPNIDGARLLLEVIFPRVLEQCSNAHLSLVGVEPSAALRTAAASAPNVTVTGFVDSLEEWLDRATVVVCPLRIGGGIKVKMLEALSRGKAIVATSIAAQGLEHATGSFVVEDDPRNFADAVVALLDNSHRRRELEEAALRYAATLPTWAEAADRLAECYESLMNCSTRAR